MTLNMETTLEVVDKQKELVAELLGPDSVYIKMKETLEDLLDKGEIKGTERAKVVAETIAGMSGQIAGAAMNAALQWSIQEKELELKKKELEYQLDILAQNKLLAENQVADSLATRQLRQAQLRREYGTPTIDVDGNVIALANDGKEYANIQNIAQDTATKVEQEKVLVAQKESTYAQTHKLVADTYINHGVFTWSALNENGMTGVTKATTGYVTLSDLNKQVAKEQARGYVYNAWSNAASAGASMLGTLAGAEIESIDSTTWAEMINLWKIPTQNLGNETPPSITI